MNDSWLETLGFVTATGWFLAGVLAHSMWCLLVAAVIFLGHMAVSS